MRAGLAFIALTIGAALAGSFATRAQVQSSPDVLLITIDDLNDWVGPLAGHPQALTPNLDRLAERGMTFTNAHTAAPLCNPSRTAFMTGLRPSTSGVYDNGPDWRTLDVFDGIRTLPGHFQDQGYETYGAGKLFHAHTYAPAGFFGLNDTSAWNAFYPALNRQLPDEVGPPIRPANANPGFFGFDWSNVWVDDAAMGDGQVVGWVERRMAEVTNGPRFLAAGIYRPHLPWYIPQAYLDMHPLEQIELPTTIENDLGDVPEFARTARAQGNEMQDWVLEQGVWAEAVQAYLASTSFADAMVGRLLDALDASGTAGNTIVVLMSDHGFHLGEKHRWRKSSLWNESTHVPLIIVAPGVTVPGSRSGKPVSLLDVYPTLTELAGVPVPDHLEGTSLLPLIEDPDAEWDHVAITTESFGNHSVRGERYRYTRYADGSEEVYDLEADPNEWTNLADDPAMVGVKQRLSARLPEVNVRLQR